MRPVKPTAAHAGGRHFSHQIGQLALRLRACDEAACNTVN